MDAIDQQIIELLQVDGRMSKRAIARELGTSEALIRKRLKRIEEQRIAHQGLVVDTRVLGLTSAAWLFLKVEAAEVDRLGAVIAELEEVSLVMVAAGRHDLMCYVWGASDEDVDRFIQGLLDSFPSILASEVQPVRRTDLYRFELIVLQQSGEAEPYTVR